MVSVTIIITTTTTTSYTNTHTTTTTTTTTTTGDDPRIELHDVTPDADKFYAMSDVLLFTSLNEVTPLVLSEAMSHRLPIITTNIAGMCNV